MQSLLCLMVRKVKTWKLEYHRLRLFLEVNEPSVQPIETKLFQEGHFLIETLELPEQQKENFLKNNYEQNEIECFKEEICVEYDFEMEYLKQEMYVNDISDLLNRNKYLNF